MPLHDWVKTIWGAVAGFLGAVAALLAAIASATERPRHFFIVAALLAAAAILVALLYVAWARREEFGQSDYRFSSRWIRLAGLCGAIVLGVLLVVAGLHPRSYEVWRSGFGSPEPDLLIPVPGRVPYRSIVVAEFHREGGDDQAIQVRRRVVGELTRLFAQNRIEGVKIVDEARVVRSGDEAERLRAERRADAVIWGFSDSELLGIDVTLRRGAGRIVTLSSEHVPWHVEDPAASLGIRGEKAVNAVAFVALYVTGQLLYLDNRYREGAAALDRAMELVPPGKLTNQAVAHFFTARAKQRALPPLSVTEKPNVDAFVEIACGYADAVRLDPKLYQAFNNLGILLKRRELEIRGHYSQVEEVPGAAKDCFKRSGIASSEPADLFAKALEIRPLPAIEFNALISDWAGRLDAVEAAALGEQLQDLLHRDPSLVGAHIILGVIVANGGDLDAAESFFRAALRLDEHFPGLRTNLAQVLRRRDATAEAQRLLEAVVADRTDDPFASLSLATMSMQRGDDRRAAELLDGILADRRFRVAEASSVVRTYYDPAAAAMLLRAYVDVRAGQDAVAMARLRAAVEAQRDYNNPESAAAEILHAAIAVLHERAGRTAAAQQEWAWIADLDREHGDEIMQRAWRTLKSRCEPDADGASLVPKEWRASGRCLGGTPGEAWRSLHAAFFDATEHLLHHQEVLFAPLG